MIQVAEIIQGDCKEVLKSLPDNSIDLICTDPPYFAFKSDWWDRQWSDAGKFLEWLGAISDEWQRILKPNGSLYCFASPRMSAKVEVMLGDRFNVVNNIRWNKAERWGRHNSVCKEELRGFFPASESIIFCEHFGADNIAKGEAGYQAKCDELRGFVFEPLRSWFQAERVKARIANLNQANAALGFQTTGGGMASHYFGNTNQWELPTPEHYAKLQQAFPGCFTREYESLRQEYESLRRPFSVSSSVPYTDVWSFPTVQSYEGKHPCEKPAALLEHIITASSKESAIVLDCFAGSGSTLATAKSLGRQYIGIEIDPHWVAQAQIRLGQFSARVPTIEERVAWLETQVSAQAKQVKRLNSRFEQLDMFAS